MRKRKIAGIVAAIATLIATLGFGGIAATASAAGTDSITLTAQSGATLSSSYKAYQLTGYDSIQNDADDSTAVKSLGATKVSDDVENAIKSALNITARQLRMLPSRRF